MESASNNGTSTAVLERARGSQDQREAEDQDTSAESVHRQLEVGSEDRKQRWSRESYNAYQREYMRRRRAK